ncbi:kinase-like domain-containing protein [Schizophyllum amplum]|uniref:Kinase-like domain-containing protein n=1 Tax=Schizophyllum amplum TaxID=97359 RepID=A0A550C0I3_9AGAR|nr:kinase-like domain-containing protein [Auriculariopsis ampla]
MVHKKLCARPDIRKTVLAEQRVLARVAKEAAHDETKHPFIAKLHMSFHDEHSVYLVLESYVCDLDTRIDYYVSKKRKFPRDLLRFYVAEICAGLAGLHAMGIAHRDVKPGNVLVDTEGHVVLADFGLAASGAKETSLSHPSATLMCTEEVGSRYFMAPEILLGSPYNAYAADWWSVGAVMWNMWTGKVRCCCFSMSCVLVG